MRAGLEHIRSMNRIRFPALFRGFTRIVIVLLCIYVAGKSIGIMTGSDTGEVVVGAVSDTTKLLAREIMDNSSVISDYMVYMENHKALTESAQKELLEAVISDYILHSEYSYDTTDPGYDQVIELVYENIHATEKVTEEPTTQKREKTTETTAEVIVPIPKAKGTVYTSKNVGKFKDVIKNYYTVTAATAIYESDMPLKEAMEKKFEITGKNKKPQILIYHTHSQEGFSNSTNDASTNIIGVGDRLAEILKKQFGYNVIHDKTAYDLVNGKLDRNEAYEQSRVGIEKILKENPSISLVIDLHRDGVNDDTRLVTEVNGKKTAQIMFFNGMSRFKNTGNIDYLYNPYLFENLALTLQMKLTAETYYPGFTRRNYINAYQYNLDVMPQTMLIEVGAQTNTYQEAKNAAEPLAVLIDKVLGSKK